MRAILLSLVCLGAPAQVPEFNRDVRPILSDKCWACHGPDAAQKRIGLRLDQESPARAARERIVARIEAHTMPPPQAGRPLSDSEIATLKQWAVAGAPWQKHWAYIPPVRKPGATIDSFINARLEKEGLKPLPRASRETLLRRVTLDLTGLPPSIDEIDRNESYEATVDRLLASPRFAERMTAKWLDAARYADSNGYQTDGERVMWRWRDWVLDAFSANMPFDRFLVDQMAGDLLPNATTAQKIATGFQRNHRGNGEGGIVDAEFQAEYAADRVETMATVLLGSTIGCARCHNHKYDPFTQKEFYQLFAYFNNIGDRGRYFKFGNTPPWVDAPTAGQAARLKELDAAITHAESKLQPGESHGALSWKPTEYLVGLDKAAPDYTDRFTIAASVTVAEGNVLSKTATDEEPAGIGFYFKNGRLHVDLVMRWLDDAIRVESEREFRPGERHHIAFTYGGTKTAASLKLYIDGRQAKYHILIDDLNQDFTVKEPWRSGAGVDAKVFSTALSELEISFLAGSASGAEARRRQFLETTDRKAWHEVVRLRRERTRLEDQVATVMVMRELELATPAHVLLRGAYDRPGELVERGIPAVLGSLPSEGANDRLKLARWLTSKDNPLTARVTVNRIWQMLFGTGIVKTVEDFGSQGEWPSHPELLDWLAVEFVESGWDLRHLVRTIVLSDAYQRSSAATAEMLARDPENRLLARASRLRLDAGQVRDQALYASGLLVEKVGGPSVKPYQPAGLWKELSGGADYQTGKGEDLYRRSIYTFWKRTAPPPSMSNFDAASRETCTVRESRTNTPLQALNLMNDVTFLEASRKLAERMLHSGQGLSHGFRLVTSRMPSAQELQVLESALTRHLEAFRADPRAARNLLAHGDSPRDARLNEVTLAAHAMVASLILNLDEGITRE